MPPSLASLLILPTLLVCLEGVQGPSDDQVVQAVEFQLLDDPIAPFHTLDVRCEDGIVTLTGEARSLLAREQAAEAAALVRGVRAVVNRVAVTPDEVSDTELRQRVLAAWAVHAATDSTEVDARVDDGHVELLGRVPSLHSARIHAQVARGVRGVRSVDVEDLVVRRRSQRPAAELQAEVRQLLRWDAALQSVWIDVTVEDGIARLTGRVASASQRRLAGRLALIDGIERVDVDGLRVDPDLLGTLERKRVEPQVSDEEIRAAVLAALLRDPRVPQQRIRVHVGGGAVVLEGTVEGLQARRAAEQDARRTVGVRRVRNFVRVRPTTPAPDQMLERRVQEALERDPLAAALTIGVEAFAGRVHLSGSVDSRGAREHVESVVADVLGVSAIHNGLRVEHHGMARRGAPLAAEIRERLEWNPLVDSGSVEVEVAPGRVVVLQGQVSTLWARGSAERDAWRAGARRVLNELEVEWPLATVEPPTGGAGS